MELTHINKQGDAIMVDVSEKDFTVREAEAFAKVKMQSSTLNSILCDKMKKGDVLATARIAGIMAGKKTSELIPLCHNIPVESIKIEFDNNGVDELYIRSKAKCTYKTGIEMEALTAASVAALTIYDMCKAVDRGMIISEIKLVKKSGGKSGDFYNE